MGYKSGGLSYFSDGSSTDVEEPKTQIQTKPVAAKGKFALPSPAGNIPMSQSVLDQMEQLYIDRQIKQGGFMESLKDATAWFSGGVRGPHEALMARDKFKQEREAEDMQMQSQLAQYRAAIAAQKAFEDRRNKELGLGGGQPTATGPAGDMFPMPAQIRQALQNAPTRAEYDKEYAKWAQEVAKSMAGPEFNVPKIDVVYQDADGNWVKDKISDRQYRMDPDKYTLAEQLRSGKPAPAAYKPGPGPAPPSAAAPAPLQTAQAAPQGGAPAPQAGGQAPMPGPVAGAQPPMPGPQAGAQPPLPGPQAGAQPPMPAPAPVAAAPAPAPTPVSAAPTPAPAPVAPPAAPVAPAAQRKRPPTAEEMVREAELNRDVRKRELEGGIDIQQGAEKDLIKDFLSQTNPMKTDDRKFRAERVAELVKSDPRIAGILSETGYGSALAGLLSKGISTPSGSISISGISDAIAKTIPGMDMEKRMELAKYLANMELDASAMMQGQGQISDSERYILRNSAINIDDPASVVYKTAKIMSRRQQMMQDMRKLYGDGKRWRGSYSGFENSPQAQQILGQYYRDLNSISNEKIQLGGKRTGPTEGQTSKSKSGKPIIFRNGNWEYQ